MQRRRSCAFGITLLVTLVSSAQAGAQLQTGNSWPQRLWVFAGLGRGSIEGSLATTFGASYSPGPLIFTLRRSGASQWFGDGIDEAAFLAGVRTSGSRAFAAAQLGTSGIHRYHTCDGPCGAAWTGPSRSAIAFDLSAQANYIVPGIGVDIFGAVYPTSHRYTGVAVILQLGWFGE
jgi:hypothetical protein